MFRFFTDQYLIMNIRTTRQKTFGDDDFAEFGNKIAPTKRRLHLTVTQPITVVIRRHRFRITADNPNLVTLKITDSIKEQDLSGFNIVVRSTYWITENHRIENLCYVGIWTFHNDIPFKELKIVSSTIAEIINVSQLRRYYGPLHPKLDKIDPKCETTITNFRQDVYPILFDISQIENLTVLRGLKNPIAPRTLFATGKIENLDAHRLTTLRCRSIDDIKAKNFDTTKLYSLEVKTGPVDFDKFPNLTFLSVGSAETALKAFYHDKYEPRANMIDILYTELTMDVLKCLPYLGLREFYAIENSITELPNCIADDQELLDDLAKSDLITNITWIQRLQVEYRLVQIMPRDHVYIVMKFV